MPKCKEKATFICHYRNMTFDIGCVEQYCDNHETKILKLRQSNAPERVCYKCEDKMQRPSTQRFY